MTDHDHQACITEALAAAEVRCARAGVRLTPLRRRVLALVWRGHDPVGAYALIDRLAAEDGKRPAPVTVYRALDFLVAQGLVHRLASCNAFVGCPEAGHAGAPQFLICRRCRRVLELDDPEIRRVLAEGAGRVGFRVEAPVIEVEGICADCREDDG